MAQTPEYILKALRKQNGLQQEDASIDNKFDSLTPYEKFSSYLNWRLFHRSVAKMIITWLEDCGFTVREKTKEIEVLNILFQRYKDIIISNPDAFNEQQEKCQYDHLIKLCNEAIDNGINYPTDKLNRWLGFIQGILAHANLINVDIERDYTRPLLHSYQNRKPPTFS